MSSADSTYTGVTGSTFVTGVTVTTDDFGTVEAKAGCCDSIWACMLNDNYDSDKDTVDTGKKYTKRKLTRNRVSGVIREAEVEHLAGLEEESDPWSFMESVDADTSIIRRLKSKEERKEYREYRKWKQNKEMELRRSSSRSRSRADGGSRRGSSAHRSRSRPRYEDESIDTRESDRRVERSRSGGRASSKYATEEATPSTYSRRKKKWLGRISRSDRNQEQRSRSRSAQRSVLRSKSREPTDKTDRHPRSAKHTKEKSRRSRRSKQTKPAGKERRQGDVGPADQNGAATTREDIQPERAKQGSDTNAARIPANDRNDAVKPETRNSQNARPVSGTNVKDEASNGKTAPHDHDDVLDIERVDKLDDQVKKASPLPLGNGSAFEKRKPEHGASFTRQRSDESHEFKKWNGGKLIHSEPQAKMPLEESDQRSQESRERQIHAPPDSICSRDEADSQTWDRYEIPTDREGPEPSSTTGVLNQSQTRGRTSSPYPSIPMKNRTDPSSQERTLMGAVFHPLQADTQSVRSSPSNKSFAHNIGGIFHSFTPDRMSVPDDVVVVANEPGSTDSSSRQGSVERNSMSDNKNGSIGQSDKTSGFPPTSQRRNRPTLPFPLKKRVTSNEGSIATYDPRASRPRPLQSWKAGSNSVC